jgi:hypothetical protein
MDEERVVESFREAWREPWFLGFATGVVVTGLVELGVAWWHDRPSTFTRCVHCHKLGADVVMSGDAWHARCWWTKQGDTLPAWLTEEPTSSSESPPQEPPLAGPRPA